MKYLYGEILCTLPAVSTVSNLGSEFAISSLHRLHLLHASITPYKCTSILKCRCVSIEKEKRDRNKIKMWSRVEINKYWDSSLDIGLVLECLDFFVDFVCFWNQYQPLVGPHTLRDLWMWIVAHDQCLDKPEWSTIKHTATLDDCVMEL